MRHCEINIFTMSKDCKPHFNLIAVSKKALKEHQKTATKLN